MAPRRLEEIEELVTLRVDGKRVPARAGEPVAVALTAAGRLTLGRSVKYHRPRGAVCYSGRCDGCLMRVDGVPSVMTCRVPAADGMTIETQNVLGSAKIDLLAATDWFFAKGMNHHEMFTWNEAVNKVMQKVARRIAGIGTLPEEAGPPAPARTRTTDVLVVGAGPAGLAAAAQLAAAGKEVHVVDEEPRPGGSLLWWPGRVEHEGESLPPIVLADRLTAAAHDAGAELHSRASAVAVYPAHEDVLGTASEGERRVVMVDTPTGLVRVHPAELVIATGRSYGVPPFSDSDTPGVIDLPAAGRLLAHGVLPGEQVLLAGEGAGIVALYQALERRGVTVLGPYAVEAFRDVRGRPSLNGCELELDGERVRVKCDAIVVQGPTSAVYELAAQAGVEVRWGGEGFELGAPSDGVHVVGGAAGASSIADALAQAGGLA